MLCFEKWHSVDFTNFHGYLLFFIIFLCVLFVLGEMDNLPEVAFYMVGPIEEVMQKAEKLAEEAWAECN